MTKIEMAEELAQIQIETMDYGDIVSLAYEQAKQNLLKLSKSELSDQYDYFGNNGTLLEQSNHKNG